MRRAAKRDANERAIIETWEKMGAYVESLSGKGLPDTLVHHQGRIFRAEVKGAKRGLEEAQVKAFRRVHDTHSATYIIRTPADAQALLDILPERRAHLRWLPEHGALAGASRKERGFRPGTDKARSLDEMCERDHCARSRSPGMKLCTPHAAEAFAP